MTWLCGLLDFLCHSPLLHPSHLSISPKTQSYHLLWEACPGICQSLELVFSFHLEGLQQDFLRQDVVESSVPKPKVPLLDSEQSEDRDSAWFLFGFLGHLALCLAKTGPHLSVGSLESCFIVCIPKLLERLWSKCRSPKFQQIPFLQCLVALVASF